MRVLLVRCTLVVAACLLASCANDTARELQRFNQGISGGSITTAFPAVVGLEIGGLCTGTLVAPTVVLTAAHCVWDSIAAGRRVTVRFGNGNGAWVASIRSSALVMHRLTLPPAFQRYDIAMIRLSEPAPIDILPIPFNRETLDLDFVGAEVDIVGFGVTNDGGPAGVKRHIRVPVENVTYEHIIFGDYAFGVCSGDSGGPTIANIDGEDVVVGVSSFVESLACEGDGFLVRTDIYVDDFLDIVMEAWAGACPSDGACDEACVEYDPDCDECGFNGWCNLDCQDKVDFDCDVTGFVGAFCGQNSDCESRDCIEALDDPRISYCSELCDPSFNSCAAGTVCSSVDGVNRCVYPSYTPTAQGAKCEDGSDCRSGLCDGKAGICVELCGAGLAECSEPFVCRSLGDVDVCSLPSGGGGCAVGNDASPVCFLLIVFGLAVVRRRRRHRARAVATLLVQIDYHGPMRSIALFALVVSLATLACSAPATQQESTDPTTTSVEQAPSYGLRLDVVPPDAEVWIGSANYGPASDMAGGVVALPPGLHRVSVKKEGFQTWRAEVTVREGLEPLEVNLTPAAP